MSWVSFITDFGSTDPYLGQLKGYIWKSNPEIKYIDYTHAIHTHDIVTAGWILRNVYKDAPLGTIHVVSVLNNYNNTHSYLLFEYQGYYFIGPNNGVFSLAFDKLPTEIYEILDSDHRSFESKHTIASIIQQICEKKACSDIGVPVKNLIMRIQLHPVVNKHQIRGSVVYIDHYGNVIINITRDQFEKTKTGRDFSIYIKRNDPITRVSNTYQDVAIGESLCLFNSFGYLEIAIHDGDAAQMMGLSIGEMIQIEFLD